jgi:glyceraldehyde-3-phosphate dehydrogenase (NADP+)
MGMAATQHVHDQARLGADLIADVSETMLLGHSWVSVPASVDVRNPEDGALLGLTPAADEGNAQAALGHAWDARHRARSLPLHERARILSDVSRAVADNAEAFATVVAMEGVKTIREARAEVARCALTLRLCAEESLRFTTPPPVFGRHPGGGHRIGYTEREPAGVVTAITPFNDPLNLVAHKLGPAIATGNAVILKPHEQTPFSALLLAREFQRAGLPPGVLQVITGRGADLGDALFADPRVRVVSFTGGWRTGEMIARTAGVKKLCLELGGNCPTIVMADSDLDTAASACVTGAYWAAGQNCLHVQRLLVQRPVYEHFVHLFAAATERIVVGRKLCEHTDMGPLVNEESATRIEQSVREAVAAGARVNCGGERNGAFLAPTLLESVPFDHPLWTQEVFGPVTVVTPFDTLDEAIALANGVEFGLQAGIFTRNLNDALTASRQLDVGGVIINDTSDYRLDSMPFGGTKKSGIGREGVTWAMAEYTEPKVVCFNQLP